MTVDLALLMMLQWQKQCAEISTGKKFNLYMLKNSIGIKNQLHVFTNPSFLLTIIASNTNTCDL